MSTRDFSNKPVVITGAASGLGAALCECFGKAGAKIAGLDRDAAGLKVLAEKLSKQGIDIKTYVCDVTDADNCKAAIDSVIADFGDIYMLVNNAGISHIAPFRKSALSSMKKVIDINLMGSIYCTSAAIESIVKTKGMIIGISSIAGFSPLCGRTAYAASKHGLVGFLNTLRTELTEEEVSVMLVYATYIQTNIAQNMADGSIDVSGKQTSGKVLMPDEAAELIYAGACEQKRMLLLGENADAAWQLYHNDPVMFEQIMLSLNKYVLKA